MWCPPLQILQTLTPPSVGSSTGRIEEAPGAYRLSPFSEFRCYWKRPCSWGPRTKWYSRGGRVPHSPGLKTPADRIWSRTTIWNLKGTLAREFLAIIDLFLTVKSIQNGFEMIRLSFMGQNRKKSISPPKNRPKIGVFRAFQVVNWIGF